MSSLERYLIMDYQTCAGMNSILLYCGHQIGWMIFPWHFAIGSMNTHAARLVPPQKVKVPNNNWNNLKKKS